LIFEAHHLLSAQRLLIAAFAILCLFLTGCEETDVGMAIQAGADAVRAATLNDEDVKRLAVKIAEASDRKHVVAPPGTPYAERLRRLTVGLGNYEDHEFDFKVYVSPKVNAFAMADGSIRIYSGLMDMMDDSELLFVVGHEMGHVVENHIKGKIRLAYAGSAVRKAVASQQNEVGAIARSTIGAMAEQLLNAQFSQQEERAADDFGLRFIQQQGHGVQPAVSALTKLAAGGNSYSFFSSHPAPEARAQRLLENPSVAENSRQRSLLSRTVDWLKNLWPFEGQQRGQ
jgi:putative metalloprotease